MGVFDEQEGYSYYFSNEEEQEEGEVIFDLLSFDFILCIILMYLYLIYFMILA